jgi:hypothetical protein
VFVDDDASEGGGVGADAFAEVGEASSEATGDGATGPDGPADAGGDTATGCPSSPPSDASVCCGAVACVGDCLDACAACIAKCTADEQCCSRNQSVTCHAPGSSCP